MPRFLIHALSSILAELAVRSNRAPAAAHRGLPRRRILIPGGADGAAVSAAATAVTSVRNIDRQL
jgi:hypothetical protein